MKHHSSKDLYTIHTILMARLSIKIIISLDTIIAYYSYIDVIKIIINFIAKHGYNYKDIHKHYHNYIDNHNYRCYCN